MPIPRKIALLCLLLASATSAQASQSLSLPQALAAAFAQNPELAAAGREVGIADGERRQAGLIPNPELSWEVEDTRRDTSTTTVTLSQPLELGGKRGARLAVAGAGQAIAQLGVDGLCHAAGGLEVERIEAEVHRIAQQEGRGHHALHLQLHVGGLADADTGDAQRMHGDVLLVQRRHEGLQLR